MFELIFAVALVAGLGALFGGLKGARIAISLVAVLLFTFVIGFVIYGFQPNSRDPQFNNWGNCIQHENYCFPDKTFPLPAGATPKEDANEVPVPKGSRTVGDVACPYNDCPAGSTEVPAQPQKSVSKKHYAHSECGINNLHSEKFEAGMNVGSLAYGERVEILEAVIYNNVRVRTQTGKTGWVYPASCLTID